MPEQTMEERVGEAFKAAVAYEMVCRGAQSDIEFVCTPRTSKILHRMIGEPDYRAIAMDLWHELFVVRNEELLDTMYQEMKGAMDPCLKLHNPAALPMEDTPPPSKN